MSRGLGAVQRRLLAILESEPARFTVEELAALVFPGETLERARLVSVRRALKTLPVHVERVPVFSSTSGLPPGSPKANWRYLIRLAP